MKHRVATTPAERSRPHRSISPPTVSSSAVPPSAHYALTAARQTQNRCGGGSGHGALVEPVHEASLHDVAPEAEEGTLARVVGLV